MFKIDYYEIASVCLYNESNGSSLFGNGSMQNHLLINTDSFNPYVRIKKATLFISHVDLDDSDEVSIADNNSLDHICKAKESEREGFNLQFDLTWLMGFYPSSNCFNYLFLYDGNEQICLLDVSLLLEITYEEPFDYLNNFNLIFDFSNIDDVNEKMILENMDNKKLCDLIDSDYYFLENDIKYKVGDL